MKRIIIFLFCSFVCFCETRGTPIKSNISARQISVLSQEEAFENPYITDGLVAMWDGIFRDSNSNVWKDCVNGIIATPNNYKDSEDYHFGFNDNSCQLRHCNLNINAPIITKSMNLPQCTYEFGLTRREGTSRFYFFNGTLNTYGGGDKGSWQNGDNHFYVCKGANNVRTQLPLSNRFPINQTHIIQVSFINGLRYVYIDGKLIGEYSATEVDSIDINLLFGSIYRSYDFTTCADVYFVRIYNRALSNEEIIYNYNVDKERFGL